MNKDFDEEDTDTLQLRETAFGASRSEKSLFVASESEGRKSIALVEPSRNCCVNAYGLLEPEWCGFDRAI